jgi:hypothetical protein
MFTSTVFSLSPRAAAPVRPVLGLPEDCTTRPVREIDVRRRAARVLAVTWQHWQQ